MPHEKRTPPLLHYYLFVSILTNLVFAAIGTIVFFLLSPPSKFDSSTVVIILLFLLFKSFLVGYVVHSSHKNGRFDKVSGTRFIGWYYGRLLGSIIGALIGAQVAGLVGVILGGVLFYFAGRWIGSKISNLIGHLLDHNLPAAEVSDTAPARPSPSRRLLFAVFAVSFPILLVLIAIYIRATDITFEGFPTGWLPVARWVTIAFSLYALATPWLVKRRMSRSQRPAPVIDMYWLGLTISTVPVCYGFFLFALGASIVELGIYALVSSGAAFWRIKTDASSQKPESEPDQPSRM